MPSDAIICLIIQIAFGLAGAYSVAIASKQYSLKILGISIAGIIGGGLGGQLLGVMLSGGTGSLGVGGGLGRYLMALLHVGSGAATHSAVGGGLDTSSILAQIAAGFIGGGLLAMLLLVSRQASSD
jgi:hypothetical protein